MRLATLPLLLATALPLLAAAAQPGRYDGQLCVATRADAAPVCGAAEVEIKGGSRVDVRVADIVYRLALRSSQLDASTLHGRMQVDEFSSPYAWAGDVLVFADEAKAVRYEVRLGARRPRR